MFLNDLFEANLPLRKGVIPNARGTYDAMVCVMDPCDFIRLTTSNQEEYDQIFADTKVDLQTYKAGTHPHKNIANYNMPFLKIILDTGKVTGHEGRHRAAMIAQAGGRSFPCTIQYRTNYTYEVHWVSMDHETWEEQEHVEQMPSFEAAQARKAELHAQKARAMDGEDVPLPHKVKVEVDGHDVMKGSPRSQGWDRDAWRRTDIPAQLVGQYDDSIVIPTSRMKFGLVKGYRHFR